MTVASHNVTVDLNGYTLTGAKDSAVFEVQEGYTLTIVDNSEAVSYTHLDGYKRQ